MPIADMRMCRTTTIVTGELDIYTRRRSDGLIMNHRRLKGSPYARGATRVQPQMPAQLALNGVLTKLRAINVGKSRFRIFRSLLGSSGLTPGKAIDPDTGVARGTCVV